MNTESARARVRRCLQQIRPDIDIASIDDETELLRERVITSFQVIDLILHLEALRGRPLERGDLESGSFRDIATIADKFFVAGESV
jgi:hypothetical protein